MPLTTVVFFTEEDGSCPLLLWLDQLPARVQDKCIVRVERLAEMGYELRRPEADFLRDGVYELRVSFQSVNYRMLYFFHRQTVVISHGLTKEKEVPDREIELAIRHRELFEKDPAKYTYEEPDHELPSEDIQRRSDPSSPLRRRGCTAEGLLGPGVGKRRGRPHHL